jgi:hypothetical protein
MDSKKYLFVDFEPGTRKYLVKDPDTGEVLERDILDQKTVNRFIIAYLSGNKSDLEAIKSEIESKRGEKVSRWHKPAEEYVKVSDLKEKVANTLLKEEPRKRARRKANG